MEYGLWHSVVVHHWSYGEAVLILVLMEYGLWLPSHGTESVSRCVLILVLMEYGLWHSPAPAQSGEVSLNPCSNGIWSLTRPVVVFLLRSIAVLILVLMEYGLWLSDKRPDRVGLDVLILVLMEYGLWHATPAEVASDVYRLNPCSNGIWSLTYPSKKYIRYVRS